jgi:hypothetical protein
MTEEQLQRQREYRRQNGNAVTKRYEKTKKGFLVRLYRNMNSRINGVQKSKHHLYKGKYLLPRALFYQWALDNPIFHSLFIDYEVSGYERKFAPSVDRIDSDRGYYPANMEFVTMSENSRRGSLSQKRQK